MINFKEYLNKDIPIGYASIGNRKPINTNPTITEWIYDTGISQSEYERNKRGFWDHFNYDRHDKEGDKLNNELEYHYHLPHNYEEKKEDFRVYTGLASHDINKFLIRDHLGLPYNHPDNIFDRQEVNDLLHDTDNQMRKYMHEAPKDFHVYSGIGPDLDIAKHRKERSDRMFFPAFTSTSIKPHIGSGFAMNQKVKGPEKKYRELIRIHIPKDSQHGLYLGSTGLGDRNDHEHEFLLNRRLIMQYIGEPRIGRFGSSAHPILVHDAKIIRHVPDY